MRTGATDNNETILTGFSVVLILNLTGCGWLGLRDRSNDYLLAEETQPTVVPADLDSATLGQIYPIPLIPVNSVELVSFEVPRPQPASVNTFEQLVKIQSVEGRRWVLINISPSEALAPRSQVSSTATVFPLPRPRVHRVLLKLSGSTLIPTKTTLTAFASR